MKKIKNYKMLLRKQRWIILSLINKLMNKRLQYKMNKQRVIYSNNKLIDIKVN